MMNKYFLTLNKKTDQLFKHCLNGFLSVIAVFSLLLIVSCSNALTDSLFVSKSGSEVSVVITNYEGNSGANSARTIAPNTYLMSDIAKFIIEGESFDGNTYSNQIAISNSGTGTIVGLKPSVWNFILHAYSDSACTNEVLRGYSTVDTTYITEVSFVLSSTTVTTEGSCSLTFNYESSASTIFSETVSEIHAWICNPYTGEEIVRLAAVTNAEDLAAWLDTNGYLAERSSLEPGNYLLKVIFYQTVNASTQKIGLWSDILIIEPGRQTTKSITIPDIIARKPESPSNLRIYRVDATQTKDYYNAVIRWDDNSNNEEEFVLTIKEYASSSSYTGTPLATLNSSNYQSISYAANGVGYISGSLFYGSEEYVVKLSTGKLYDVELYAKNSYGKSSTITRVASSDIAGDYSYGNMTGYGVSASEPYLRANSFVLTYDLADGNFISSLGKLYTGQNYVEYHIYTGTDTSLLSPAAITDPSDNTLASQTSWPICYYSSLDQGWLSWYADGDSNKTAITSVSTFTNRKFHAQYNIINEVELYMNSDAVYITSGNTDILSRYGTGTDIKGTTNISAGTYVTITIDRSVAPNSEFTRFDFYVNDTQQSYNTVTLPSAESYITYTMFLSLKGTYTLKVSGAKNEQYYYSEDFTFIVQ